jgi:hypothetical protein
VGNKKPVKGKWDNTKLDLEGVDVQLKLIRHYSNAIAKGLEVRSINVDVDYGELFDAVERLYGMMRLDLLAQDNKMRAEKVRRQVDDNQKAREA